MKLERTAKFNPALFAVVPLLNVLFVVLAFFALSSSFLLQPGISVNAPVSNFALNPQRDPLLVSITSNPVLTLYFEEKRLELADMLSRISNIEALDKTLIIRADRAVPYDVVMRVANAGLERGLDVVLAAGEPKR